MTDSVAVFAPGDRLTDDTTGDPIPGGVVRFYYAGTSTPKTVYADKALSTALGTSVTMDSLGYPTSDGSTPTLVYVGTAAYKVTIETSGGTVIKTHDNVQGAVTTLGADDVSVAAERPVIVKSLDYTVLPTDQNAHFMSNCSGGAFTYTLPSAVTVGDGWAASYEHAASAEVVKIATVSSQTITEGVTSYATQAVLSRSGESMTLISNGGNWVVAEHTGNPIVSGGVIPVEDRVTAAPGSPVEGGYYIVSSAYSTFSTHDVLLYTGASYVAYTPAEGCGWVAYVKDEDIAYIFTGTAWGTLSSSLAASQAQVEAVTTNDAVITPANAHYHPGAAKFWAYVTVTTGTPTLVTSYNVTSITDTDVGKLTVTIGTDFSSADWCCVATTGSFGRTASETSKSAGSVQIESYVATIGYQDPASYNVVGYGDH